VFIAIYIYIYCEKSVWYRLRSNVHALSSHVNGTVNNKLIVLLSNRDREKGKQRELEREKNREVTVHREREKRG